ncbi:MAG TPA: hypothetical protein VF998_03625 [Candidatus Limnocylindria bacterium]
MPARIALRVAAPILAVLLGLSALASADPGDGDARTGPGGTPVPFRRTTPRASLIADAAGLLLGIPAARAWGAESGLMPLDGAGSIALELTVDDPDVAEGFVRIAYYARATGRSRQLATQDSPYVRPGESRRVRIELHPPAGAVAYRVRVLGRLVPGAARSDDGAIRARWLTEPVDARGPSMPLTRLARDPP